MAIKTSYNFKGIEVKDAYVRIDRIWGSSKEGWTALVGVYNVLAVEVPAIESAEAVLGEDGEVVTSAVEAAEATTKTIYHKLEEFNHNCEYSANERGYVSMYTSLKEKLGGEDV